MTNGKICPLLFASACSDIEYECRPDRCAWAYEGECAMLTIARSMDGLNEKGIIAWVETEGER